MGTFQSFRKAYGALKDSTTVGLAKVNSEFKDLDIAIVKATNHVESPPKERHIRKIFAATSVVRPRADVAYCIHALARRLTRTRNWIVAIKVLIVIHRTLREGDPTFREELMNYSHRGHILQISNFKDDSSPLAWDCSAWVRTYALFLEERLECYRILKYDIEAERLTRSSPGASKVHSRTRLLSFEELLEQLPALQQLLYRLIGCQPEGAACSNYLIQYALALVLKESFKIYCAINDGIINLVDMFFDLSKHDAVKALNIYKRAGQQAERLADFYDFCKHMELARNFQFPILRQPPPSFLATMEEYVREAPQTGSVSNKRLEYEERSKTPRKDPENSPTCSEKHVVEEEEEEKPTKTPQEESQPESKVESPPLISTEEDDLLGLREVNPHAAQLEESNALALAIVPPGNDSHNPVDGGFNGLGGTGWELALVSKPSHITNTNLTSTKLAGGFDKLLLDSLYEDENARRQLNHGGYGPYATSSSSSMPIHNSFGHHHHQQQQHQHQDPFIMSSSIAPPTNVQMAMVAQQHHHHQHQPMMMHHQQHNTMMMIPYQNNHAYPQHMQPMTTSSSSSNPFGDPFAMFPQNTSSSNHGLL